MKTKHILAGYMITFFRFTPYSLQIFSDDTVSSRAHIVAASSSANTFLNVASVAVAAGVLVLIASSGKEVGSGGTPDEEIKWREARRTRWPSDRVNSENSFLWKLDPRRPARTAVSKYMSVQCTCHIAFG